MSLRILQFGKTGQLATELRRRAVEDGLSLTALSHDEADFSDPAACAARVAEHAPDMVVIAAAYTAVDQAETERDLAFRINAETPGAIARAAHSAGASVVHVSTDYVFDGTKGAPYVETDPPRPLNVYGASKLAGEEAVLEACPRATVLRASWVVSAHGRNFVKTMLRLAGEGQPLRVVDDQVGRPTAAGDLAQFILDQTARLTCAAGDPAFGLFHFANAGEVSWKGFAEGVLDLALGDAAPPVAPIRTVDRPAPARRPLRGTLDTTRLERVFAYQPRPWREALVEIVDELKVTA